MITVDFRLLGGLGGPAMGRHAFVAADCEIDWKDKTTTKLVALVDTGAGRSWIDIDHAPHCLPDEIDIPARSVFGEETKHLGYMGNVVLGGTIGVLTTLVSGAIAKKHMGIHMILGLDILSHGRLEIDYPGRRVTFSVPYGNDTK